MYSYSLLTILLAVAVTYASCKEDNITPTQQCPGQNFDNIEESIQVVPCGKNRCRLRRGSNSTVYLNFKPKRDMKELTTRVLGNIAGISIPFIGFSGTSACQNLLFKDGSPARCPLKANTEYVYKNQFYIEKFYPQLEVTVEWALHDAKGDVICVVVPAAIK